MLIPGEGECFLSVVFLRAFSFATRSTRTRTPCWKNWSAAAAKSSTSSHRIGMAWVGNAAGLGSAALGSRLIFKFVGHALHAGFRDAMTRFREAACTACPTTPSNRNWQPQQRVSLPKIANRACQLQVVAPLRLRRACLGTATVFSGRPGNGANQTARESILA
jgi:hypothetical protein